jgi:hypothetical protein
VGHEADPKLPATSSHHGDELRHCLVGERDDPPGVLDQRLARRRQLDLASRPLEQLAAELLLECTDLSRKARAARCAGARPRG